LFKLFYHILAPESVIVVQSHTSIDGIDPENFFSYTCTTC